MNLKKNSYKNILIYFPIKHFFLYFIFILSNLFIYENITKYNAKFNF